MARNTFTWNRIIEKNFLVLEQITTFESVEKNRMQNCMHTKNCKTKSEHLLCFPKVPSKASGYVISAFKPLSTFVKDHDTTLRVDLKKQWTTDVVNSLTEQ